MWSGLSGLFSRGNRQVQSKDDQEKKKVFCKPRKLHRDLASGKSSGTFDNERSDREPQISNIVLSIEQGGGQVFFK
ncbi:MAG: hypothetical protein D3916_05615 [Candidatus Electrothrix sp. MAN1_4]|nr:hypothetical protein [Candidatus Electrothrix sp. MAN1_4]